MAEGNERNSTKDYNRFLNIAKGSCGEVRTQLYVEQKARKNLNLIAIPNFQNLLSETQEISAMLQGLINSLKKRLA